MIWHVSSVTNFSPDMHRLVECSEAIDSLRHFLDRHFFIQFNILLQDVHNQMWDLLWLFRGIRQSIFLNWMHKSRRWLRKISFTGERILKTHRDDAVRSIYELLLGITCRDGTLSRFIWLKLSLSFSFKCNNELFDVNIFFNRFFDEMGLKEKVRLKRLFALYKPLKWRWREVHGSSTMLSFYLRKALPTEFKPDDVVALIVECVDKVSVSLRKSIDDNGVKAPFSGPTFSINEV